jgi:predicted dehydrogenase
MDGDSEVSMKITVGVIGYNITRLLIRSLASLPYLFPELDCDIRLKTICGRNEKAVARVATSWGFKKTTREWRELTEDPEIDLVINGAPNYLHADPCISALESGKHVFCEKPMAPTLEESALMAEAARKSGSKAMMGFNCRFVPAVILAKKMIAVGKLGSLYHSRFQYCDEAYVGSSIPFGWRMDKDLSGRGILGDLGSHAIDLARFLVSEPLGVSGITKIFVDQRTDPVSSERREVTAPDAAFAILHYSDGSEGTLEASSFRRGRKNYAAFEINAAKGAIRWDLERMNELGVYLEEDKEDDISGFRRVDVGLDHPSLINWPQDYPVGIDYCYTLEMLHLVRAIKEDTAIAPEGADFDDGLKCEIISESIEESSRNNGQLERISYTI